MLHIDNFPTELLDSYDLQNPYYLDGRQYVNKTCSLCEQGVGVRIDSIKTMLKKGGISAKCKSCTLRTKLEPKEIPETLQHLISWDEQRVVDNSLVINVSCSNCSITNIHAVTYIRDKARANKFTGLCASCAKSGNRSPKWRGGRKLTSDGYVLIYEPQHPHNWGGIYVPEHRLVIEEHIGRYLTPVESVHHKNGIRDDNRIENLELWVGSHVSGQRYNDLNLEELINLRDYVNLLINERSIVEAA